MGRLANLCQNLFTLRWKSVIKCFKFIVLYTGMSGERDKFLSEPWSLNQLYCCLFSHHSQFGDKVTISFRDSYYRNRKSVFIGDARTKQLPLARKKNVLGHVAKRKWAHSLALCNSVFPSRFFSVVNLWLSLLLQHDTDKGFLYHFFSEDRCEGIKTKLEFYYVCVISYYSRPNSLSVKPLYYYY